MLTRFTTILQLLPVLVVLLLGGCTSRSVQPAQHQPTPSFEVLASFSPLKDKPTVQSATIDANAYTGWQDWCEPVYYKPCETAADCSDVDHPAEWPLKCVTRWSDNAKVCAPGYDGSGRWRKWRHERLREIVRQQYFDEAELCDPDRPVSEQNWKCQGAAAKGNKLTKFLWLVYFRETTGRPWKRHRLDADLRANQTAWASPRVSSRYGWKLHIERTSGEVERAERLREDANQHYLEDERWQAGLGPYGMIAAGWTHSWDRHAPPEILCREVEATEVYLRRARGVWKALKGGVDCDRDGQVDFQVDKPTWALVHRGASGGKTCPKKGKVIVKEGFKKRMRSMGLDPYEEIPLSILGEPIPKATQNERAAEITAALDERTTKP